MLESILNKLTIKELGKHLSNYANLFIRPIESWKKSIGLRSQSYDFVILHLVYYTIILLIILRDLYIALPLCLFEVIMTLIPFLIFIIPFKILVNIFKIKLKWLHLFRLFLIIKLQFLPVFILLYEIAIRAESESLYIIVDNFIWLIWLGFIFIMPSILKIKFFQKAIWIFLNYLSFLVILSTIVTVFSKIDLLGNIGDKLMLITPDKEYSNFNVNSSNSTLFLQDSMYLLIGKEETPQLVTYQETQFVSLGLAILFNNTVKNRNVIYMIEIDSSLCVLDRNRVSKKDSLLAFLEIEELTKSKLDSFRLVTNNMIETDLELTDSLKTKAKFKSNREFFDAQNNFLNDYYNSYSDNKRINKVLEKAHKDQLIKLDNGQYVAMYILNKSAYSSTKERYVELKNKLDKRSTRANFLMNIVLYPLEKIYDIIEFD